MNPYYLSKLHKDLETWGLECKEPIDLFNSLFPGKKKSINIESVEKLTRVLNQFIKNCEDLNVFALSDVPALKGIVKILHKIKIKPKGLKGNLNQVRNAFRKNKTKEDWNVKISVLVNQINRIVSKQLLNKELKELGQTILLPEIWGIIGDYEQNVKYIREPVDNKDFVNIASLLVKKNFD